MSRKFLGSAILALAIGLIAPALAAADAPDVTTAKGEVISVDASGNQTVRVTGTWEWFTHHSDCRTNRAGIGAAVDWGDNNGNHVTTLNGDSIDVGVANATLLNTADNVAHPAEPGVDIDFPSQYRQWSGGCGVVAPGSDHNNGTFGSPNDQDPAHKDLWLTHVYPAGPLPRICAITYDVHGSREFTEPNGSKEVTAGGNNRNPDNGAEKNASTPAGNTCFEIKLKAHPSVTTNAGPDVQVGASLSDTATLSGGQNPTGTITFTLYGPNDPNCTGTVRLTSTKNVNGNGTYTSDAYTQTATTGAGTYHWIANYSGDNNNDPTTNGCNEANENVVVGPGNPSVTTNAGPSVDLGDAIHDTATLSGGSNPKGKIVFKLYGPNNANCTGNAIFTSEVSVNGNGNYASDEFTPTAAGTYRWIANYESSDANNTNTSNGCNAANENVLVIGHPRIRVDKRGAVSSALAGSNVEFILDVTNPGDQPLHDVAFSDSRCNVSAPALDTKHGDGSPTTLDPGDLWTYRCTGSTAVGDTNIHNEVEVCALPPTGAQVCDTDTTDVPLRNPDISIDKTGPASVARGTTISYTLDVKNTGDQRFPEANVVLTDAQCDATPVLQSKNGDSSPAFLNPGETWTYTCSKATDANTTSPVHNVASVTGTDEAGDQVTDSDTADTTLTTTPPPGCQVNCGPPPSNPNPGISINKTGPATATAGDTIPYLLDVTNTGDQPFSEPNLSLSDALCGATPTLSSKNGDQTPTKLNPGETWTYTCSVPTAAGQTSVHNVGSVCGLPDSGQTVCDEDDADTVLAQVAVEPLLPGVSRLRGPTGCIAARTHVLTVTGRRIARVSFYLDGRYIGTRTKPNRGSAFTMTVRGAKLRRGSHRVTARVTYQAGTNPQTRTLQLTFARCARALTPKFTG